MKMARKVLSVILIISLLFVVVQTTVSATDDDLFQQIQDLVGDTNTADTNNVNNVNNVNTTNNVTNIANTNNTINNTSSNETLPKTGMTEDYAIIAFAVVCGISAIYAYKKVKNYNIK